MVVLDTKNIERGREKSERERTTGRQTDRELILMRICSGKAYFRHVFNLPFKKYTHPLYSNTLTQQYYHTPRAFKILHHRREKDPF